MEPTMSRTKTIITICIAAVFVVSLYLFASSFRYKEIKDSTIWYDTNELGSNYLYELDDSRVAAYNDYAYTYRCPVFIDTWRGRLCYFDSKGKKHYTIPKQKKVSE